MSGVECQKMKFPTHMLLEKKVMKFTVFLINSNNFENLIWFWVIHMILRNLYDFEKLIWNLYDFE